MPRLLVTLFLLFSLGACNGASQDVDALTPMAAITPVAAVQGNGDASPLVDQIVTVVGVVTGDFQNDDADNSRNLGGFFLQSSTPDDDPDTSDGIFIFDGDEPAVDVVAGQVVQVTGIVKEWFGETQIAPTSVTIKDTATVESTELIFPAASRLNSDGSVIIDLEPFEGMLVHLAETASVSENFSLARYGELTLVAGGRAFQFTNANTPDVAGYAQHVAHLAARTLILDDGLTEQNPQNFRYLYSGTPDKPVRIGDSVAATGNIRYSRGSGNSGFETYRLVPTNDPEFHSDNPRSSQPPDTGGAITVASFNVMNYFTTIDTGRDVCGPTGGMNCRGADSDAEFSRQHAKTISSLLALDADVVGLMELENDGGISLQKIVDGLNMEAGAALWSFIDTGKIGTDAIAVGLIYKTTVVEPATNFALLRSSIDSRFNDGKNRPSLAQTFAVLDTDGRFTVAVNHLKSKGSPCDDIGDANLNDGQGNCNRTRTSAAAALADWLNADPTNSDDADVLIIGDLNSYLREDPLEALEYAGFINLLNEHAGSDAYSFVFGAQAGALDHALASRALNSKVTGVAVWHINADEPPLIDYNLEFDREAGLFDELTPFRSSDHDPIIVGINP